METPKNAQDALAGFFFLNSTQISTNITHMRNKRGKFQVYNDFHFAQLSPSEGEVIHLSRRA